MVKIELRLSRHVRSRFKIPRENIPTKKVNFVLIIQVKPEKMNF